VTEVTGGHKKALFTLAVPRSYRDGEGKKHRNVAFVPVTAWRALAAQVEPLGKDSAVLVEGHLRSWSDPKGKSFRLEVEAEVLEVLERHEPAKDEPGSPPMPARPERLARPLPLRGRRSPSKGRAVPYGLMLGSVSQGAR